MEINTNYNFNLILKHTLNFLIGYEILWYNNTHIFIIFYNYFLLDKTKLNYIDHTKKSKIWSEI